MEQVGLVKAPLADMAWLALDVPALDVDLGGLREAGQLLVRGLGGDDARIAGAEAVQAHGEVAGEQGMELHEAGPRLANRT